MSLRIEFWPASSYWQRIIGSDGALMRPLLFAGALVILNIPTLAQSPAGAPTQIYSPRPMEEVVQLFQRHGKVVTYEEALLVWSGDLVATSPWNDPNHKWGIVPKSFGLTLPPEIGNDADVASVLQKIIVANYAQPIGPRFGLLRSKWGYHIVPVQSHDADGMLVTVQSVLDSPVNVPVQIRSPFQHVRELLTEVKKASGIFVDFSITGSPQRFDSSFLGRQGTFEWGASGVSGRDALIDLFSRSQTTLFWTLACQPSALPEDRYCALVPRWQIY
jgi:hypothetical protein